MNKILEQIDDILKITEVSKKASLFKDRKEAEVVGLYLKKNINAPFINVNVSTLGGLDRPSILIKISLDKKEDWPSNIFQNSRYIGFHIDPNPEVSNIEQFMKSYTLKKNFRKQKGKTVKDIVSKINNYIKSIK